MNKNKVSCLPGGYNLPSSLSRLYMQDMEPSLGGCILYPLEFLVAGKSRWNGMLPQFSPFGADFEENVFGWYILSDNHEGKWPVLRWNADLDYYTPVATGTEEFLLRSQALGLYEMEDDSELEVDPKAPQNERQLHESFLRFDSGSVESLNYLGCLKMSDKSRTEARKLFSKAIESAPWFMDSYVLKAKCCAEPAEAAALLEQALLCSVATSTRVEEYNIDPEQFDCSMVEYARMLLEKSGVAPESDTVRRILAMKSPFTPDARLELAQYLHESNDIKGEERELLNALAFITEANETQIIYPKLIELYHRIGRDIEADLCRMDSEMPYLA